MLLLDFSRELFLLLVCPMGEEGVRGCKQDEMVHLGSKQNKKTTKCILMMIRVTYRRDGLSSQV